MDGYRVFTWDAEPLPGRRRACSRGSPSDGFRVITIVDPGVKYEPGYWVFDQALERDVLCRTEGGDIYIGQVWPGDTAFPDFVTEDGRGWWGELNAAHVQSGLAGIWNDMNEPATGEIAPDRMRFDRGRALARALPQPVRAAHGDGHDRAACATRCRTCARSSSRARASPASSATPPTGWATTSPAGTTSGSASRWRRASACPARRSSAPTSAGSQGTPTPSCSCAGCSTAR